MKVTVKLFASLRLGRFEARTIDCEDGFTVEQIVRLLSIPTEHVSIMLVNSRHVDSSHRISDGDMLALFPPVGGDFVSQQCISGRLRRPGRLCYRRARSSRVGRLSVIDPDVFEEHNLNRQLLSTVSSLGRSKADAASERVSEINPAVTVIAQKQQLTKDNGEHLLQGSDVVVDALDTIPARLQLAEICSAMKIPLVHGSIGGWYGQIMTQMPREETVWKIFSRCSSEKGIERDFGNPSFTTAVIAAMEVAEVCKLLLDMEFTEIAL